MATAARAPILTDAGQALLALCLPLLMGALLVLSTLFWLRGNDIERLEGELITARANARTAWGKVYDMQDLHQEELEAAGQSQSMALYDLQRQLDGCRAGK